MGQGTEDGRRTMGQGAKHETLPREKERDFQCSLPALLCCFWLTLMQFDAAHTAHMHLPSGTTKPAKVQHQKQHQQSLCNCQVSSEQRDDFIRCIVLGAARSPLSPDRRDTCHHRKAITAATILSPPRLPAAPLSLPTYRYSSGLPFNSLQISVPQKFMQIGVAFQFRRLRTVFLCPPVSDSADGHALLPLNLVGHQVIHVALYF